MNVPPDHKYAAVFLSRCGSDLPDDEDVGGVRVGRYLRVDWAHWAGWLGSIMIEELKGDGLLLYVTAPSRSPRVDDDENQFLKKRVDLVLNGLLVLGVPEFMRGVIITGMSVGGALEVRNYSRVRDVLRTPGLKDFEVDTSIVRRAVQIADRLQEIEDAKGIRWARLARAVATLLKANNETNRRGDRLHQFVRAFEGLTVPRIMRSAPDFAHRGQTFATGKQIRQILLEIFKIRNQVEHLHLPTAILSGSSEQRIERVNHRTRQMDVLARVAISRVLESSDLFENVFDDDAHLQAFWSLHDGDRMARWGKRLNIAAIP